MQWNLWTEWVYIFRKCIRLANYSHYLHLVVCHRLTRTCASIITAPCSVFMGRNLSLYRCDWDSKTNIPFDCDYYNLCCCWLRSSLSLFFFISRSSNHIVAFVTLDAIWWSQHHPTRVENGKKPDFYSLKFQQSRQRAIANFTGFDKHHKICLLSQHSNCSKYLMQCRYPNALSQASAAAAANSLTK